MAPERFHGVSDPRCDVYALGATLYEMLTLRPCFSGQSHAQLIHRIEHELPVPPRQIEPGIPADLETIVLKALAKVPGDRFESADEMGAELRRYVENRPIRSRPIPAYQRFWRWCVRNPGLAAAGALAAAATIAAAAATIALAVVSSAAARTYSHQVQALEKAERKARLELGNSLVTEGAALQRSGLVGQRFDSLDRLDAPPRSWGPIPRAATDCPKFVIRPSPPLGWSICASGSSVTSAIIVPSASMPPWSGMHSASPRATSSSAGWTTTTSCCGSAIPNQRDHSKSWGAGFSPDGGLLVTLQRRAAATTGIVTHMWDLNRRKLLAELESNDRIGVRP